MQAPQNNQQNLQTPQNQVQQDLTPMQKQTCTRCGLNFSVENIAIINLDQKYCDDCLEEVLQQQQKQIRFKEQRYIFYKQFQSSLDENEMLQQNNEETKVINQNQKQIEMLIQELKVIEANIKNTKVECQSLKNQVRNMEVEEEKFWEQVNRFDKRAIKLQEKALSAKFDKNLARNQIQKISKTSIIHSFTQIQIDDNIGYVLGLAMGKKSDLTQINWEQLNAGLGHILMALNFLAINYHYEFQLIEAIKIKGTLSEVLLKNKKQFYHLGYTGRDQEKPFGEIMQAILAETLRLSDLMQESQKLEYSEQMRLPFKISEKQGKIGQYYIDPSKIQDRKKWTQWTKAIRYFLINFKHLLTIYSICDHFL